MVSVVVVGVRGSRLGSPPFSRWGTVGSGVVLVRKVSVVTTVPEAEHFGDLSPGLTHHPLLPLTVQPPTSDSGEGGGKGVIKTDGVTWGS